jgi:hypothetical protein
LQPFYVFNYILMCTWFALIFFVINKLVHWIWPELKPKLNPLDSSLQICMRDSNMNTISRHQRICSYTKLKCQILPNCITIDASFILYFLALLPFIHFLYYNSSSMSLQGDCIFHSAWIDVAILTLTSTFEFLLDRIWNISTNIK